MDGRTDGWTDGRTRVFQYTHHSASEGINTAIPFSKTNHSVLKIEKKKYPTPKKKCCEGGLVQLNKLYSSGFSRDMLGIVLPKLIEFWQIFIYSDVNQTISNADIILK